MIPKSSAPAYFYRLSEGLEGVESLPSTAGPWSLEAQHGGPPAALLGRAVEGLGAGVVGRFTMDLLGPVPVGELGVSASVVRPGRSVSLVEASLHDAAPHRPGRAPLGPRLPPPTPRPGSSPAPSQGRCQPDRRRTTDRPTAPSARGPRAGAPATSTPWTGAG